LGCPGLVATFDLDCGQMVFCRVHYSLLISMSMCAILPNVDIENRFNSSDPLSQRLLLLPRCPISMPSHPDASFAPIAYRFFLSTSLLFTSLIPHLIFCLGRLAQLTVCPLCWFPWEGDNWYSSDPVEWPTRGGRVRIACGIGFGVRGLRARVGGGVLIRRFKGINHSS
jgi:hypothetical protein